MVEVFVPVTIKLYLLDLQGIGFLLEISPSLYLHQKLGTI